MVKRMKTRMKMVKRMKRRMKMVKRTKMKIGWPAMPSPAPSTELSAVPTV